MTPKQTALLAVARLVGISMSGALVAGLIIHFVPLPIIGIMFALGLVAYLIKMLYEFELDKAETLSKMVDKYKD